MIDLRVDFKTFMEDENETTYELTYKKETYLIFVKHDGKFHNKLWECEKEIPAELEWFLHDVITEELKNGNKVTIQLENGGNKYDDKRTERSLLATHKQKL